MTYHPFAETHDTGTAYWESLGLIGGSTGMAPLITASTTIPALDDYDGTAVTITDSVAKSASGAAVSWAGWDFSSSISKGLMVAYIHGSTSNWTGVGFHVGTLPASGVQNTYQTVFENDANVTQLGEHSSGSFTAIGADHTIYQADSANSAIWGIALYVDGSSNVQKTFIKSGISQWIQVLPATDSDHSSFQSCYLRYNGENARFIAPIMVWGA